MAHQGFGFCEFLSEEDADYAVKIMNQIKLFGKPIRVNKSSTMETGKKDIDIGANLFIGNLDTSVDEQQLTDTFGTFGNLAEHPKVSSSSGLTDSRSRAIPQRATRRATVSCRSTSSRRPIWRSRI